MRLLFSTILLHVASFLSAQVSNNSIKERAELILDAKPVHSNTNNSSVEWACVNKSLTNKCLVYHNDQWFDFTPPANGTYFLNISSQQCRDMQGIQVVVIEGNPCEVNTYRMLKCIPKIYLDDIYIELDSLHANTLYLVNIDGFLKDFCELDIQLSSKPNGLPLQSTDPDAVELKADMHEDVVQIQWHMDQKLQDQIGYVELYRLKAGEVKSTLRTIVYTNSNALGKYVEDYAYTDTLVSAGMYQYKVMGVEKVSGNKQLLDQVTIDSKPHHVPVKYKMAQIPLSFDKKGELEISVFNPYNDVLLYAMTYDYIIPEKFSINLTRFVNKGVHGFLIKVKQVKTREIRLFEYQVNEAGEVVMVERK